MNTKQKTLLPWLLVIVLAIMSLVLWIQVNDLKHQYNLLDEEAAHTRRDLEDANSKLDDANSKIQNAQQEAENAQQQASALSQPVIYAKVGWAPPDDGTDIRPYAVLVSNEDKDSTLSFTASRNGTVSKILDGVTVPPNSSMNIYIPGWTFVTGDTLTVSEDGHQSATWTVPSP